MRIVVILVNHFNKIFIPWRLLIVVLVCVACHEKDQSATIKLGDIALSADKAIYKPNDIISFTANQNLPLGTTIRYRSLDETLLEIPFSSVTWSWQVPSTDFTGYLIDLYGVENGKETIYAAIAVDVSSDWKRFPRYGFLSKFPQMSNSDMDRIIQRLTRLHMNGLQFYDWAEKHHKPLAGTPSTPSATWFDIANRLNYKSTVEGYITKAKQAGMNTMSYNLCYGALSDAASDGVQNTWYMFTDGAHSSKAVFDVPGFLKSPIYLLDPANTNWQAYIASKNADMYSVFGFDGYHIDQLGSWGTVYNYSGQPIDLAATFQFFINAMEGLNSGKKLVFNAVNQFGQQGSIASSSVEFLYTEVWNPNELYEDLAAIITNNDTYSNNNKSTVLAAYVNYNKADRPGIFNTPGVLFADAVIFSFGGAHIELGEHMLGKEYFPNSNLQMTKELEGALINYYDFAVAYENLLRDGGLFNNPEVKMTDNTYPICNWPPQTGKVVVVGKQVGSAQVLHLHNFITNSLDWRDTNGTKTTATAINAFKLSFTTSQVVSKVWFASPDVNFGVAKELAFVQIGGVVNFTVPSLLYWDMLVIE